MSQFNKSTFFSKIFIYLFILKAKNILYWGVHGKYCATPVFLPAWKNPMGRGALWATIHESQELDMT